MIEPCQPGVLIDDDASGQVPVARDAATGADLRQAVESGDRPRYRLMVSLGRVRLLPSGPPVTVVTTGNGALFQVAVTGGPEAGYTGWVFRAAPS